MKKKRKCTKIKKCPVCGGKLNEVEGETEIYLHCVDCYVSVDSDCGYTD